MVHFLPELITLNYCEGPYMTPGLPKFSHGLHQKISSLNRDSYQTLNSASFPLLGGWGLCPQACSTPLAPTFSWCTDIHQISKEKRPTALSGAKPRTAYCCSQMLLGSSDRMKPQVYVTPPSQQPQQNSSIPRGTNFALQELAEINASSNP